MSDLDTRIDPAAIPSYLLSAEGLLPGVGPFVGELPAGAESAPVDARASASVSASERTLTPAGAGTRKQKRRR